MIFKQRCRRLLHSVSVLIATVHLAGCHTWTPTTRPLGPLLEEERPYSIRVASEGGESEEVRFPWVLGDTLFSVAPNCRNAAENWSCDEPAVPVAALADLDRVELEELSALRSAGAVVLGVVLAAGVVAWAVLLSECSGSDGWFC